jgi:hypothetical protein
MDDYAEQKLTEFCEDSDRDLEVEDVKPAFDEKLDEARDRVMESMSEERLVDYVVGMLEADEVVKERMGGSGEEMELKILSIGHRGVWEDHPQFEDEDVVTAHGVIHGPIGDDGQEKAAKAILFLKKSNVDLLNVQSLFEALNELKGTFKVEKAWDLGERGFYRCYSCDETDIEEADLEDLPSSRDDKNDLLRRMFEDVKLSELGEDGTGLSAFQLEDGNRYTLDWGADVKRFTGTVQDLYIADDNTFGLFTMIDDSVTADDIEDTALVGDDQNIPGLTVYAQPDYHMNYGRNSVLDIYGVVETNNDGQIIMRAAGVVPIIPMDMDDEEQADEGVDATESTI